MKKAFEIASWCEWSKEFEKQNERVTANARESFTNDHPGISKRANDRFANMIEDLEKELYEYEKQGQFYMAKAIRKTIEDLKSTREKF